MFGSFWLGFVDCSNFIKVKLFSSYYYGECTWVMLWSNWNCCVYFLMDCGMPMVIMVTGGSTDVGNCKDFLMYGIGFMNL